MIDGALKLLVQILDASAPELDATATYYRQTDLAAAAAIDRTMPQTPGQCPTALEYEFNSMICKPVEFADPRLVTDRLKAPPEPDTPHNALGFMDYLSPTSWAMKGFDIVLGFDPISWVQERFAGGWEALAAMDAVLGSTAEGLHDLAFNIQSGVTTLHPMWLGNAGDAAYDYFTDLATSIVALDGPLREIGRAYQVMADAVWAAGEAHVAPLGQRHRAVPTRIRSRAHVPVSRQQQPQRPRCRQTARPVHRRWLRPSRRTTGGRTMTTDVNDITGGDPRRARVLRNNLNQLAEGPNPLLREMAKAVLAGELRLRDAAQSDTYGGAIGDAFDTFWTRYEKMSNEEREQLTNLAYQHIEHAD